MGGDHAPAETVAGAVAAAARGVDVVLVGDETVVHEHLAAHGTDLPVVHAGQIIGMGANPAKAIRDLPDASIVRAAKLVKTGEADALVSAGSTGAALAAAAIVIGRIPGVLRPTIASIFPTPGSHTVVLDSGANPDCKPEHLAQFGLMGSLLAQIYLECAKPRVGLLTIGEERGKGRDLERAAYDLMEWDPRINFIGNVEGRDIATDVADVFVTDGFTGNIMLKTTEGALRIALTMVADRVRRQDDPIRDAMMPEVRAVSSSLSADVAGGAHLIGSRGVVVIGHGSSSRVAIENALVMAADGADRGLVAKLTASLADA